MDISLVDHSTVRIKGKAAVVVVAPDGSVSVADRAEENPFVVRGPGEYEIKGVGVIGMSAEKNTVYRIEIDGMSIVRVGPLEHPLTATQVDTLDGVDILMVSVSGGAASVISEVEPSIVIPLDHTPDGIRAFLKEIGKEDVVPQPKLSVTKDKIPEQMLVVVLS